MRKIYYTSQGVVCERAPFIAIENENMFIVVDEATFQKSLSTPFHFRWMVKNGALQLERYEETPVEEIKQELRERREIECFNIVNRGQVWYAMLTEQQKFELANWYKQWLDATQTLAAPIKPMWL